MRALAIVGCLVLLLILGADADGAHNYNRSAMWGIGTVEIGGHDLEYWHAYARDRQAEVRRWRRLALRYKRQLDRTWPGREDDVHRAMQVAAETFDVSYDHMHDCNHAEGGHTASRTLQVSLRTGSGKGWNTSGSFAFGPWQYMLGDKPPSGPSEWGTFGRYDDQAFAEASRRGVDVPRRYRRPDSYSGQAFVTGYMFSIGQSGQWVGAGC